MTLHFATPRADSDHMKCSMLHKRLADERGFGLIEAVVATALFLILRARPIPSVRAFFKPLRIVVPPKASPSAVTG